jgi:hypothetical protein
MFDFLHSAWPVITGWFHPDVAHGVFWGSMLVTFVGSVMGDDQVKRLQNGAFGAAAGTSIGGLAGLLKNQTDLVVVGFVASAVGGFLGWFYYVLLALWVGNNPDDAIKNNFLAFQSGGLAGLRERLDVKSREDLKDEFQDWCEKFAQTVARQKLLLLRYVDSAHWQEYAEAVMRGWLVSAADTLALVYGTLADKPKTQSTDMTQDPTIKAHSQSRVTIIVFGVDGSQQIAGTHWICYSGQLTPHDVTQNFDEKSIGNKVRSGKFASPYFSTSAFAKQEGQKRADDPSYRPFITFRLNNSAVLAVDWPEGLPGNADYVEAARSLFYSRITPAVTEVLDRWPSDLAQVVGLNPLPPSGPRATAVSPPAPSVPVPAAAPSAPPIPGANPVQTAVTPVSGVSTAPAGGTSSAKS